MVLLNNQKLRVTIKFFHNFLIIHLRGNSAQIKRDSDFVYEDKVKKNKKTGNSMKSLKKNNKKRSPSDILNPKSKKKKKVYLFHFIKNFT